MTDAAAPLISVVVANWNGAAFLEAAVTSALRQTHRRLEVIVADDASTDASAAIVARLAAQDDRVRWLAGSTRGGPAAARNRALAAATGDWIAILDSDDLFHPDRLTRLLAAAETYGADMVADDLLLFDDLATPRRFLCSPETRAPFAVTPAVYARQTILYGRKPNLGFLKPMIRTGSLRRAGAHYDERLRIGEDDDLILQLLAAGLRYRVAPSPTYFYRRHPASTSHRLRLDDLKAMADAFDHLAGGKGDIARAFARRRQALTAAIHFQSAIEAMKQRRWWLAARILIAHPRAVPLLRMPIAARWRRRPVQPAAGNAHNILFVSRQRIVGRTNGSSAYLLDLAAAVRGAGFTPHLLQPSPTIVGRRPLIRLRREMTVFASHRVRGVWKVGPVIVSREARVWRAALIASLSRLARRWRLPVTLADTRFPHSIAVPWTDEDRLFVAAHHRLADAILVDYAFQVEAIPFVRPGTPSAIIMHDRLADSGLVSRGDETALLGRADVVVAIQRDEAAWVAQAVPGARVIVAPIAARPLNAAQPGCDDEALFVGSDTPPNVIALRWLFAEIWPVVLRALPGARLRVAGTVAAAFAGIRLPRVDFLGLVADLAPLYAEAGVVVSPLTTGSGLKVKLVEALARGKAMVVTGVTLQGVESETAAAVRRADTATAFAADMIVLLADAAARRALGDRALAAARTHFSPQTCHAPLLDWLHASVR